MAKKMRCAICQESFSYAEKNGLAEDNSMAEMWNPKASQPSTSELVHGMCGVMNGWEMA